MKPLYCTMYIIPSDILFLKPPLLKKVCVFHLIDNTIINKNNLRLMKSSYTQNFHRNWNNCLLWRHNSIRWIPPYIWRHKTLHRNLLCTRICDIIKKTHYLIIKMSLKDLVNNLLKLKLSICDIRFTFF